MSLFNYFDDEVSLQEIESLIINQTFERRTIDYKAGLELTSDEQKKEFLADIVSFANAGGGFIIYGLEEVSGVPQRIVGLISANKDILKGKIENIIRDGISPRIVQLSVVEVVFKENAFLIVIKIPISLSSPHLVSFKHSSRFFSRNSSHGKYQLDVNEIRQQFLSSENLFNNIRDFRLERVSKIINGYSPVCLVNNPKFIMHIVPYSSFLLREQISTQKFLNWIEKPGPFRECRKQFNFEGLILHNQFDERVEADYYFQIFRNGTVEVVNSNFAEHYNGDKYIFGEKFEDRYLSILPNVFELLNHLNISFPIALLLSITNIKGYKFFYQARFGRFSHNRYIQHNNLLIPDIVLNERKDEDLDISLKPIFDPIWNASGFHGSVNYNSSGKWQKEPK